MNKRGQTDIYKILLFCLVGIILIAGIIALAVYFYNDNNVVKCKEGGKYDKELGKCLYPAQKIPCPNGTAFNQKTLLCEKPVVYEVDCEGVFNKTSGICSISPDETYSCDEGILTEVNGEWSCVVDVEVENNQTCSELEGSVCSSNQSCSSGFVNASDSSRCCLGSCEEEGRDLLVTFRVDDPYFSTAERPMMENLIYLAKKYGIKFNIMVVANQFDKLRDPQVFKIYEENKDIFEISAHAYKHSEVVEPYYKFYSNENLCLVYNGDHNELGDPGNSIPRNVQEFRIKAMRDIFLKYNLSTAIETWVTPFGNGDINTVDLANKYGYKFIQLAFPLGVLGDKETCDYKGTIVTGHTWGLSNLDSKNLDSRIASRISTGERVISFIYHPWDFNSQNLKTVENEIELLKNSSYQHKIKFGFFSDITQKYYDNLSTCPSNMGLPSTKLCGNGLCNIRHHNETPISCPQDCDLSKCGDRYCDWIKGETESTCLEDCANYTFYAGCSLATSTYTCPNNKCEKDLGENSKNCPQDCYSQSTNITAGTVTDIQGNIYKTVKIGEQWWMAENLKTSKYADGTLIPQISSRIIYWNLEKTIPEGWVNYAWNSSYDSVYGKLYSWPVINNSKNICPTGWHVPTDEELTKLEGFADTQYEWDSMNPNWTVLAPTPRGFDAGKKLKSVSGWRIGGASGTDDFGFNATPGGYKRNNACPFYGGPLYSTPYCQGNDDPSEGFWYSVFWTSTPGRNPPSYPGWLRMYSAGTDGVPRGYGPVGNSTKGPEGAYIRCIKDSGGK